MDTHLWIRISTSELKVWHTNTISPACFKMMVTDKIHYIIMRISVTEAPGNWYGFSLHNWYHNITMFPARFLHIFRLQGFRWYSIIIRFHYPQIFHVLVIQSHYSFLYQLWSCNDLHVLILLNVHVYFTTYWEDKASGK